VGSVCVSGDARDASAEPQDAGAPDGSPEDAGRDGGRDDAGPVIVTDAGASDGGEDDAGAVLRDAGRDGGPDGGRDSGPPVDPCETIDLVDFCSAFELPLEEEWRDVVEAGGRVSRDVAPSPLGQSLRVVVEDNDEAYVVARPFGSGRFFLRLRVLLEASTDVDELRILELASTASGAALQLELSRAGRDLRIEPRFSTMSSPRIEGAMSIGRWACIELEVQPSTFAGELALWVDEVEAGRATGIDTALGVFGGYEELRVGVIDTNRDVELWVDDVAVARARIGCD